MLFKSLTPWEGQPVGSSPTDRSTSSSVYSSSSSGSESSPPMISACPFVAGQYTLMAAFWVFLLAGARAQSQNSSYWISRSPLLCMAFRNAGRHRSPSPSLCRHAENSWASMMPLPSVSQLANTSLTRVYTGSSSVSSAWSSGGSGTLSFCKFSGLKAFTWPPSTSCTCIRPMVASQFSHVPSLPLRALPALRLCSSTRVPG
mmetsp:Transcript_54089/g.164392  ORF Transcript_54089/g.164392 Transcript_54089/m.164392 type:complete len:202 (+) Transcript_54089:448-1053(+)